MSKSSDEKDESKKVVSIKKLVFPYQPTPRCQSGFCSNADVIYIFGGGQITNKLFFNDLWMIDGMFKPYTWNINNLKYVYS